MADLYWLSFADANRAVGDQFLGAALVESASIAGAIQQAWRARCNPGGGIRVIEIPVYLLSARLRTKLDTVPRDTLLSFDDLDRLGLEPVRVEGLG